MAYSLSGERPLAAARPFGPLAVMLLWVARLVAARRRRQTLMALLDFDEHRLWDLGISRHDIARALRSRDGAIDSARDWRQTLDVWPPR